MARSLSFEQVDATVQRADLTKYRRGGNQWFSRRDVASNPAEVIKKLCAVWRVVGSIVKLVAGIPLLPAKWREALKTLIALMDTVCEGA